MDSFLLMKTTSPERVVVMPVPAVKVFLGGGGGGDLATFSDPCLANTSPAAGLGVFEVCLSAGGFAGFSSVGLGSFSGPFLAAALGAVSALGSSETDKSGDEVRPQTTMDLSYL